MLGCSKVDDHWQIQKILARNILSRFHFWDEQNISQIAYLLVLPAMSG